MPVQATDFFCEYLYQDISGEWLPENPKLGGSGIVACRPQIGDCAGRCQDCFFRGGRYYEDVSRPHVPHPDWVRRNRYVVRMNDGNDSNHQRDLVIATAGLYDRVFFNTRLPCLLFPGPVVLTVNGDRTDDYAHLLPADTPGFGNLMAVRVRVNTWNLPLVRAVIRHYGTIRVPIRLTYMAYYQAVVREPQFYEWRKRTLNSYWCLKAEKRAEIEAELSVDGRAVQTCTTKAGEHCRDCGQCIRSFLEFRGNAVV